MQRELVTEAEEEARELRVKVRALKKESMAAAARAETRERADSKRESLDSVAEALRGNSRRASVKSATDAEREKDRLARA